MKMQNLLDKRGSMLHKKVILFGRSISLSVIVALATVTIAAAVWGVTAFTLNVNVTSGSQDTLSAGNSFCNVMLDNNSGPDATICSLVAGNVNISNATPGDQYFAWINFTAPVTNTGTLYAQPIDVSAWGGILELVSDSGCGYPVPPGSNVDVGVVFMFDADGQDTSPSSAYGPFPIVRQFAPTVPTCP